MYFILYPVGKPHFHGGPLELVLYAGTRARGGIGLALILSFVYPEYRNVTSLLNKTIVAEDRVAGVAGVAG